MGKLIDGVWQSGDVRGSGGDGTFRRPETAFRNWITPDGAPGPTGTGGFKAESGRYHLYVSYACPWAHRALILRALKGLTEHISVDVVHPFLGADGWHFATDYAGATGDRLLGKAFLREVYTASDPEASGRVTVPVLWDRETAQIVSNESAEIVRMLNAAFEDIADGPDLYPAPLRAEIDAVNDRIYETVNNGVYRAGFARTQAAYDQAVAELFETLDRLEQWLSERRYLMGAQLTEADWRLFPTLLRFDPVYHGHFKCNRRRLADYPSLWGYMLELYQWPGIAGTTDLEHIRYHYYASHETVNPSRIVPVGPEIDYAAPHGRGDLSAA